MTLITTGVTRNILLIGNYAIKFPKLSSYREFIWGISSNIEEKQTWEDWDHDVRLCPILLYCPFALFIVMPKVDRICTEEDEIDYSTFKEIDDDNHPGNFGFYQGRLVMLDYG